MPSAFISHSTPDDRYVQEMVQYLRKLGYDEVFNDSHTIEPDDLFWTRIEQGIRECDAFVVILSHASVQSYWVDREVQFARAEGKKVIPVRIDDCQLPPSFDGRDVIDLRHGRGDKVTGGAGGHAEAEAGGTAMGGPGGTAGELGSGGKGGNAKAVGPNSLAHGGPGGRGGVGPGGSGTDADASGGGLSLGGEGGEGPQSGGFGGRGGQSGAELLLALPDSDPVVHDKLAHAKRILSDDRVATFVALQKEYLQSHSPTDGVVPQDWLNQRLRVLGMKWSVQVIGGGYRLITEENEP